MKAAIVEGRGSQSRKHGVSVMNEVVGELLEGIIEPDEDLSHGWLVQHTTIQPFSAVHRTGTQNRNSPAGTGCSLPVLKELLDNGSGAVGAITNHYK